MDKRNAIIIIKAIVREQQGLVGPLAIGEANKVPGLVMIPGPEVKQITGDEESLIRKLVDQYSRLFGQTSVEVCKEAVKKVAPVLTDAHIPDFLK